MKGFEIGIYLALPIHSQHTKHSAFVYLYTKHSGFFREMQLVLLTFGQKIGQRLAEKGRSLLQNDEI